jgi:DNA repair protein RecN (Recombination protein N)
MLTELSITNFAIIDHLHLVLPSGLLVLTGETGAGKSIIIDAVSTLLGGRADAESVRSGTEGARVEGIFSLSSEALLALAPLLQEHGLTDGSDSLILTREINRSGRHVCRVNGRAITLAVFSQIGERLIDIHGQGEHLSLLRVREHLSFLDRYAGLQPERAEVAQGVQSLRSVREELEALRRDERELARRVDLLQYQVREIDDAHLEPDEEGTLVAERRLLANAERLHELADSAFRTLTGGEDQSAVLDQLGQTIRDLGELEKLDPQLGTQRQIVEDASYQLDDAARGLRAYRDRVEFNPVRLQAIDDRLDLLRSLKRKYGSSVADVLRFGAQARLELDGLTHSEERIAQLVDQEAHLVQQVGQAAAGLSSARAEAAQHLAEAVEKELDDLQMAQAQFVVDIQWREDPRGVQVRDKLYSFNQTGIDQVEFLISPNLGEPPKAMVKIASGGETSRLMLALKAVLTAADSVPTLIFDEIDQGIGGRVGGIVGRKLWGLTSNHQVLCITHLPQLAAYGDSHWKVTKEERDGRTLTVVHDLDEPGRLEELGAMAGGPDGKARRRSVEEMYQETLEAKRKP